MSVNGAEITGDGFSVPAPKEPGMWDKLDKIAKIAMLLAPVLFLAAQSWLDARYAKAEEVKAKATIQQVEAVEKRSEKADDELEQKIDEKFDQILCLLQRDEGMGWVNGKCQKVR